LAEIPNATLTIDPHWRELKQFTAQVFEIPEVIENSGVHHCFWASVKRGLQAIK